MNEILLRRSIDVYKRRKTFLVDLTTEDQQCKTRVRKSFMYAVDIINGEKPPVKPPLVFIHKLLDTKRGTEEFGFHVKGCFYITHNQAPMKVRFCHRLDITIQWKALDVSPKESESLI